MSEPPKKWNLIKHEISKKGNLKKKKKKWNKKISEHNQCQCQIMSEFVETIKKDLDCVSERKTSPHILTRTFAARLSAYGANT